MPQENFLFSDTLEENIAFGLEDRIEMCIRDSIFLIGFMGAGKSTVAGELKDKLEMDRVELDQMIVENRGMSISEIFDEFGRCV